MKYEIKIHPGLDGLLEAVWRRAAKYEQVCIRSMMRHRYGIQADALMEENERLIRHAIGKTLYREMCEYPLTNKESNARRKQTFMEIVDAIEGNMEVKK